MSNAIQSLSVLHNNPFILAPLFSSFYDLLGGKPQSILLSYFILPIVLYPSSQRFLLNANSKSSVMTMAGKSNKRDRLYGLDERIIEYHELTNISFQYAIDMDVIRIKENLSIEVVSPWHSNALFLPDHLKAAKRLGILFRPFDVPTIYRMLGVKKI
jgi:hypothetical protein